jgi:hypothetical protein
MVRVLYLFSSDHILVLTATISVNHQVKDSLVLHVKQSAKKPKKKCVGCVSFSEYAQN